MFHKGYNMKFKNLFLFLILLVIVVIGCVPQQPIKSPETSTFPPTTNTIPIYLNQPFELSEGQKAMMGGFWLTYEFLSGDMTAQMRAEEQSDTLRFNFNNSEYSQKFHEYLIRLLEVDKERLSLVVISFPGIVKISEEQAVNIAIEIAKDEGFINPGRGLVELKNGIWEIEIDSETPTDLYIQVLINSSTGEVIYIYRASRA